MLKSCQYCGRIHDKNFDCGKKPVKKKYFRSADKFRGSNEWKYKREHIKERDNYLCQVCIRKLYGTIRQFNASDLSVHHAVPIEEDYDKRLDDNNLITICNKHHEMAESGEIPRIEILKIINEQQNRPPEGH